MTIVSLILLIWDRRELLKKLLEQLPVLLNAAGAGMETAGVGALGAARVLKGSNSPPADPQTALSEAASALDTIKTKLDDVATYLEKAADEIGKVKISVPTITEGYVTGVKVITGITLTDTKFFAAVETQLDTASDRMETASTQVGTLAERIRTLADSLDDTGDQLNTLGSALKTGGQALKGL
jgi:uncharacterized phage infection (PIP) family protein YhgE